ARAVDEVQPQAGTRPRRRAAHARRRSGARPALLEERPELAHAPPVVRADDAQSRAARTRVLAPEGAHVLDRESLDARARAERAAALRVLGSEDETGHPVVGQLAGAVSAGPDL